MAEHDNMVSVLLRELRDDMTGLETRLGQCLDRVEQRLGAMHLNGMKALKSFVGHRALTERARA